MIAEKMEDLTGLLGLLAHDGAEIDGLARADEVRRPQDREKTQEREKARTDAMLPLPQPETGNSPITQARHARETARVMPKGRNFH